MVTFEEFQYTKPDLPSIQKQFHEYLNDFNQASTFTDQNEVIEQINDIRRNFSTQQNIVYIRASINTNDTYYQEEREYFDHISPQFQELETAYYEVLVQSPFREQLEKRWGAQLFELAECAMKTFSPEVMPLLQQENKLSSEYAKLLAQAQIDFNGDVVTLAQLGPFMESTDRAVRKQALQAYYSYFEMNAEQFDRIYDELVQVRHEIAIKLGFKNFVELGYLRMNRIGYGANEVEKFRNQVQEHIVPLATSLYDRQKERIGVDSFTFYDEPFKYTSGNAQPHGPASWIIDNGKKMFAELSPETNEFFQMLIEQNLVDLEAKKGKEAGGYCTYIDNYQAPFIFSNFNGTSGDIDVLTHEVGHAFQVYCSRKIGIPEYVWPTSEAAEIHSMSMEFFAWPWMELFFKEDTLKYQFSHLVDALLFIPYGVAVDEFQHRIYEQPSLTPIERKNVWKEIEQTYLPHRNYDGIPFLEQGGIWQRQAHIYEIPFYYIDYTLAQISALQFWQQSQENFEKAWQQYVELCQLGGSKSFTQLLKSAKLQSPFENGTIETIIPAITAWLDSIDDLSL